MTCHVNDRATQTPLKCCVLTNYVTWSWSICHVGGRVGSRLNRNTSYFSTLNLKINLALILDLKATFITKYRTKND